MTSETDRNLTSRPKWDLFEGQAYINGYRVKVDLEVRLWFSSRPNRCFRQYPVINRAIQKLKGTKVDRTIVTKYATHGKKLKDV